MIKELRKKGHKVSVCHVRRIINPLLTAKDVLSGVNPYLYMSRGEFEDTFNQVDGSGDRKYIWGDYVQPCGGLTMVRVDDKYAETACSISENYRKKRGVSIALGRLFK